MNKTSKIYIAGHAGLVGSAIWRNLEQQGYTNLIGKRSSELDLTRQKEVEEFFATEKPDYVFLAAAKVGGIHANDIYPADFIYTNMMIEGNVIHAAHINKVKKLMFLGSGCIYPRMAEQPIKEEYLLTSELEKTNEAYAVAKIAGLKLCEYYSKQYGDCFVSAMPCNLYGQGDNYHLENSHVIPALLRKFHEAKEAGSNTVELWGTGTAMREFMHIDDAAAACVLMMDKYSEPSFLNIGYGSDITIKELAAVIGEVVGFSGEITYNSAMPDGTPKKLLDSTKLFALGFRPTIDLKTGLAKVYQDYLVEKENYRK